MPIKRALSSVPDKPRPAALLQPQEAESPKAAPLRTVEPTEPPEPPKEPLRIKEPGLYGGIAMADYLADPCVVPSLNASTIVTVLRQSPKHGWARHPRHPKPLPRKQSKEANIGSVAHALLLEKSEEAVCVINPEDHPAQRTGSIPDGWTNASIRAAKEQAIADGLTPLLPWEMDACRAMRDEALEFIASAPQIAPAFQDGEAEMVAIAQEGPIWLRCRPDWISKDRRTVVHLKTTARSARPETFIRGLLPSMGYDLTLGFYGRVLLGATGIEPEVHCILAQEQEPPYACSLIGLNPEYTAIVTRQIELGVDTWARCMRTNVWPAYPTQICYAEPKPWQIADVEEEEIRNISKMDPMQAWHGIEA